MREMEYRDYITAAKISVRISKETAAKVVPSILDYEHLAEVVIKPVDTNQVELTVVCPLDLAREIISKILED